MNHYTRDTLPYPLCFRQSTWSSYVKEQTQKREAVAGKHGTTTTDGIKRRTTEIQENKKRHLTWHRDDDSASQETAAELSLRRRREMQVYDQLHPLSLVDIVLDKEPRREWAQQDEEKMELSDDWMLVEEQQQHTQTNPLADPDAGFNRFLECWPLLAPHQRTMQVRRSAANAAAVASTDEANSHDDSDMDS